MALLSLAKRSSRPLEKKEKKERKKKTILSPPLYVKHTCKGSTRSRLSKLCDCQPMAHSALASTVRIALHSLPGPQQTKAAGNAYQHTRVYSKEDRPNPPVSIHTYTYIYIYIYFLKTSALNYRLYLGFLLFRPPKRSLFEPPCNT